MKYKLKLISEHKEDLIFEIVGLPPGAKKIILRKDSIIY